MSATTKNAEAVRLLEEALSILGRSGTPSPGEHLRNLTPVGVELRASRALYGTWWYYLVMPRDWRPSENEPRRWIYDETKGRYWDTGAAETESWALVAGLRRLLDTVVP